MANQESIARGNHTFFVVDLAQAIFDPNFIGTLNGAMFDSLWRTAQCGVPSLGGSSHYLRIACSFSEGDSEFHVLQDRFKEDFFEKDMIERVPSELYMSRWSGKNDEVTIQIGGWKFDFRIVEYERDGEHGFVRVKCPWEDDSIPDEENLNRAVELLISPVSPA